MIKLYYIANARMPTEKAHGIQIAKMCEAFLEQGVDLVLVLPRRGLSEKSIRDFYGLRVDISVKILPTLNVHNRGPFWYYLSSYSFIFSYFLYFFFFVDKKHAVLYTADFDQFFYRAFSYLGIPFFIEMHGAKPDNALHRKFFSKAKGIIPTNRITKKELQEKFHLSDDALLVEPNGVDLSDFAPLDKQHARARLGLPQQETLVLYVGRFFEWKGLEILAQAAPHISHNIHIGMVGGTAPEFERITTHTPDTRIQFFGSQPYSDMPQWVAAADALLVLGTKKDEQSYQYTSPMKVFEYMASKRPIIASRTPALQDLLPETACYFYEPDNVQDLAHTIERAIEDTEQERRLHEAYNIVLKYTWESRAKRIRAFMNHLLSNRKI